MPEKDTKTQLSDISRDKVAGYVEAIYGRLFHHELSSAELAKGKGLNDLLALTIALLNVASKVTVNTFAGITPESLQKKAMAEMPRWFMECASMAIETALKSAEKQEIQ